VAAVAFDEDKQEFIFRVLAKKPSPGREYIDWPVALASAG
jgi:hypothetical protein